MVKFDNKEVSNYFNDKECIEHFDNFHTMLFSYLCTQFKLPKTAKNYVHYCEALFLFLEMNSNPPTKSNMPAYVQHLLKRCQQKKHFSPSFVKWEFSWDNEIDPDKVLTIFSPVFKAQLLSVFQRYQRVIPDLTKITEGNETYPFLLVTHMLVSLDNYRCDDTIPFSLILMKELINFCIESSPFNDIPKDAQDSCCNIVCKLYSETIADKSA